MPPIKTKQPVTDLAITPQGPETTPPTRTATKPHPRLVNRGPAGLLHRSSPEVKEGLKVEQPPETLAKPIAKHRIAPALAKMAVSIDSVTLDPNNARLHPERNMEAIKESLTTFGQVKPIVVQKSTGIVVAGNGTLEAARALGWESIAANFVEMSDAEAAAYGLADNRTAELAKWNFEVIQRLDKIASEAGLPMVGWSTDELEVLRAAEWIPPTAEGGDAYAGGGSGQDDGNSMLVGFDADQYALVLPAIEKMREIQKSSELSQESCLTLICQEWHKAEVWGRLAGLDDLDSRPAEEEQEEDAA